MEKLSDQATDLFHTANAYLSKISTRIGRQIGSICQTTAINIKCMKYLMIGLSKVSCNQQDELDYVQKEINNKLCL